METTCSSETSVDFQRTTQYYFPEYRTLHNHRCETLPSRNMMMAPMARSLVTECSHKSSFSAYSQETRSKDTTHTYVKGHVLLGIWREHVMISLKCKVSSNLGIAFLDHSLFESLFSTKLRQRSLRIVGNILGAPVDLCCPREYHSVSQNAFTFPPI
jgi:hypothetical protein